jgi:Family of unknown function (DUF6424)
MATHTETEGKSVKINIPDHPGRAESAGFVAAKKLAKKILATIPGGIFGTENVQMHHGGSLWAWDGSTWHLYLNTVGMEWSSQFCADPAKVELLRVNAQALYGAFPETAAKMVELGYKNAQTLLDTPITDAKTIAAWVDSIFNSCVPLPAHEHTGSRPTGSGEHHYPRPITNIQFIKRDDFQLWHDDPESGTPIAVVPTAHPGTVDAPTVQVVYAQPGTKLHHRLRMAHDNGEILELDADHPVTKEAFSRMQPADAPAADGA